MLLQLDVVQPCNKILHCVRARMSHCPPVLLRIPPVFNVVQPVVSTLIFNRSVSKSVRESWFHLKSVCVCFRPQFALWAAASGSWPVCFLGWEGGGEKKKNIFFLFFLFVSLKLTDTWGGRGTTPASYMYIHSIYRYDLFKSIGRQTKTRLLYLLL